MKKIVKLLTAILVFATVVAISNFVANAAAQQNVTFTRPSFDVVINGYVVDTESNKYREYPFYVYNDITYFPMTYNDCATLGLMNNWTMEEGNAITYGYDSVDYLPNISKNAKPLTATATLATGRITAGGVPFINAFEQYPVYNCNNVLYFPMTWNWTRQFGWTNTFVDNTLYITADIDYAPISLVNRNFVEEDNGDILYCYDIVNNTGRHITAYRYDLDYYDSDRNRVKNKKGYIGTTVTGEKLAPYETQTDMYVDLTDNLEETNCEIIRFSGITNVLFSDGTIWRQPILD